MTARLTLLVTSPRLPAGLLTRDAWRVLETASVVLSADGDETTEAIRTAEVPVETVEELEPAALAAQLVSRTVEGDVVWIGSPDGDAGLTDALAGELTRQAEPPEVEVLVGSWDPPGARLLDAVTVMDRLRSPGGCPWDAEQTHASLTPYLLEEAYETVEAVDSGDVDHLAEELGDVLLQVLFQARIAGEHEQDPFDVDDVAAGLVAKLVRRHPHVFADVTAQDADAVERNWEQIKAEEKPHRDAGDLLAGIPEDLPTPLAVAKVRSRVRRRGGADALDGRLAELGEDAARRSQEERSRLRVLVDGD